MPDKLLISWLALNNDFKNGQFNREGPTARLHRHHLPTYNRHHILLSWKQGDDNYKHFEGLLNTYLTQQQLTGKVTCEFIEVDDPIDANEIQTRLEKFLNPLRKQHLEAFISPGTPAMQVAWYLVYLGGQYRLRLFQTRSPRHSKTQFEREYVSLEKNILAQPASIRQQVEADNGEHIRPGYLEKVYSQAKKIAQADGVSTLIIGETGSGKEGLSRYIHEQSIRAGEPFVAVNSSAFKDELLESRLFGYKKGAFTGADKDREGFFKAAEGGTLFLDEIGDISPYMQQSLLRVLQEGEIQPVGDTRTIPVDVRIVAATNKDLVEACEAGKFRWDLYYRLAVTELYLPPLREGSKKDVMKFIDFFLQQKKEKFNRGKVLKLTKEVKDFLLDYPFPGNIRELENLVEKLYVHCEEEVQMNDLPHRFHRLPEALSWELKVVERRHIDKALKHFNGNKTKTSEALGIALNTLKSKLAK
jgi:DNA-binding NtrC family response regulator